MSDQQQCCFKDSATGKRCEKPIAPQTDLRSCEEHLTEIEYWRNYYSSMLLCPHNGEVQ